MKKKKYDWKYVTVGGVTRVSIERGADIAHLADLDRKQWTVLSCPVKGLELDERTLALMDSNADGHIHVDEVIATAQWLVAVLKDPDILIKSCDSVPLAAFNTDNEEGLALEKSARQILANLEKGDADTISVADTSDSVAIFAKTRFNGDGIITPASTDDESLKKVMEQIIATVGSATDRSGAEGVDTDHIEQFYTALAEYSAWQADSKVEGVLPFGADTEAALAAVGAIKDKVSDFFMRCKLTAFATEHAASLDVTTAQIDALSAADLSVIGDEVASLPLAHVTSDSVLPFKGINPAWQAPFDTFKAAVVDKVYPDADGLTEAQWLALPAMFGAYSAWKAAKKGEVVETLGLDTVDALLAAAQKDALLALVAEDKSFEKEAADIDAVDKLTHLCRDFYTLLRNYVSMNDFYASAFGDVRAIFQAGRLFIDQRSSDLCIRVEDMGKHGNMAALSGMYIVYCNCSTKLKPETMTIAAVLTDGDVDNLRPGTNAVFYDRNGLDWDAVVTSIVDNPISVRQAFWRPYKKLSRWINDKIDKSASEKDATATQSLITRADNVEIPDSERDANAAVKASNKQQAFDIAKFCGIFASIGLALGFILDAFTGLSSTIAKHWYNIFIIIGLLVLCVSGPSMFIAWKKLRKRDLAPLLNANGWAINSKLLVNTRFGSKLTSLAKYPRAKGADPFRTPAWLRWLRSILLVLAVAFAVLFFSNKLERYGLPYNKKAKATSEQVVPAADAPSEAPAPVTE